MTVLLAMTPFFCQAQLLNDTRKVDTLTIGQRFTLRTNTVDWFLQMPNLGVEYDLGKCNYNRWSLGLNLRGNLPMPSTFKPGTVFNFVEARVELRNYYRLMKIDSANYIYAPKGVFNRLFSIRRNAVKHPLTTYYRGVYAAGDYLDYMFTKTGRKGLVVNAGVLAGIVRPLYVYQNGSSLDFEAGFGIGASFARFDKYSHAREFEANGGDRGAYVVTEKASGFKFNPYGILNDVHVSFVYRVAKYPILCKYRNRIEVDETFLSNFAQRMETEMEMRRVSAEKQAEFNTLYELFMEYYNEEAMRMHVAGYEVPNRYETYNDYLKRIEKERQANDARREADKLRATKQAKIDEAKAAAEKVKAEKQAKVDEAKTAAEKAKAEKQAKADEAKVAAEKAKAEKQAKADEAKAAAEKAKAEKKTKKDKAKSNAKVDGNSTPDATTDENVKEE